MQVARVAPAGACRRAAVAGPVVEQGRAVGALADPLREVLPLGDRAQPLVQEDEPGPVVTAVKGLVKEAVVRGEIEEGHGPGPDGGKATATRPSAGGPPRAGGRDCRLFEEVLERLAKSNRERVSTHIGTTKKGRIGGCCGGGSGGRAAGGGRRSGSAPPARCGVRAGWGGQKKEQGQRPCSGGSGGDERLLSSCADGPPRPDQPDRCRRGAWWRARGRGCHLLPMYLSHSYPLYSSLQ